MGGRSKNISYISIELHHQIRFSDPVSCDLLERQTRQRIDLFCPLYADIKKNHHLQHNPCSIFTISCN